VVQRSWELYAPVRPKFSAKNREQRSAFSVSEPRRGAVIRTIQDQEQHHRRISFQEEFLKLLRNHGVEFDERNIGQ
jgi:hypothetical protein